MLRIRRELTVTSETLTFSPNFLGVIVLHDAGGYWGIKHLASSLGTLGLMEIVNLTPTPELESRPVFIRRQVQL